jgi:hypothetical protein
LAAMVWKSFATNCSKNKLEIMVEVFAMVAVFGLSLWYFLNIESIVTLQLSESNSHCHPFKSVYSIQSQASTLNFVYKIYIESDVNQAQSELSTFEVKLFGYWQSCSMSAISETAPILSSKGWSGSWQNKTFSLHNETIALHINLHGTLFYSLDSFDVTPDCFRLVCEAEYGADNYTGPVLPTFVPNFQFEPNGLLAGQIIVTETAVSASCSASLFGTPVNYYSVSNSLQLSDSGQCTVYNSMLSGIALSLPFAMTTFSLLKALFYFWDKMK